MKESWSFLQANQNEESLASEWSMKSALLADRQAQLGDRFAIVRYEDLKRDLAGSIDKLGIFMGFPPEVTRNAALLDKLSAMTVSTLDEQRSLRPPSHPGHETRPNFFRRGETDSWKRELTHEQIGRIEEICGPQMIRFGYERSTF
jgi:hypothetical protein